MSELVNYKRSSDYVSEDFSDTVSEIAKIYAKSIRTTLRTISLVKPSSKELSGPPYPVPIAMQKMLDIPAIRIIEGLDKRRIMEMEPHKIVVFRVK